MYVGGVCAHEPRVAAALAQQYQRQSQVVFAAPEQGSNRNVS